MSDPFDEWCAKRGVTPEERSALVTFLATFRAQRTLRALADAPSPPETPAPEGTTGDRDRLRDGIEAAARVLAANGIDARPHLDLRPDARREVTEILAGVAASPASAPSRGTDHDTQSNRSTNPQHKE